LSVVIRTMQGREYIHVRRKISGLQKQKFYPIDGLSDRDIALLKHKANALDEEWRMAQGQDSLATLLCNNGIPSHIRVCAPNDKQGWTLQLIKHQTSINKRLICARSIDKYGFDKAFNVVYKTLIKGLGIKGQTVSIAVFKAVFYSHLFERYQLMSSKIN